MKRICKHHTEATKMDASKGDGKSGRRKFFRSLKEALASVFGLKAKQEKLTGAKVKLPEIKTMKQAADTAAELEATIAKVLPIVSAKSEATFAKTTNPLAERKANFGKKEPDRTDPHPHVDNDDKPRAPKNGEPFKPNPFLPVEDPNKWSLQRLVKAIESEKDTWKRADLYKEYKARLAEPGRLVRKMTREKNPTKKQDFYRRYESALARLK
jgi:hypothetical protein